METPVQIPVDAHIIYGTLVRGREKSKKLIVHAHGLTHSQNGYLQLNSGAVFNEAGYDVFRFSFYERTPKARRLSQTTLSIHQKDLQTVLDHFADDYDDIYLIGHSLGGLVSLILNPENITAMSLWDPSFDVTNFWASGPYLTPLPEKNAYILDYGCEYVIGEDMVEEIKGYPHETCLDLARRVNTPTQMVIPELSIFLASPHTSPSEYDNAFAELYERIDMDGAGHCFYEEGMDQKLFQTTLSWFDKF